MQLLHINYIYLQVFLWNSLFAIPCYFLRKQLSDITQFVYCCLKKNCQKKCRKSMQQPQKALWVVFRSQFFLTSEFKENLQNITLRMRCRGLDDSFFLLLFLFARLTFNFHQMKKEHTDSNEQRTMMSTKQEQIQSDHVIFYCYVPLVFTWIFASIPCSKVLFSPVSLT